MAGRRQRARPGQPRGPAPAQDAPAQITGEAAPARSAGESAAGGLSGPAQASSVIPRPPRQNKVFVEDDDGTGADNQANILSLAAPGMVHAVSATGVPVGAGRPLRIRVIFTREM